MAIAAALSAAGCAGEAAGSVREAASGETAKRQPLIELPVSVAAVRDGDLVLGVNTTGVVRSTSEVTLRADVAGTVTRLAVSPGDSVRAGATLLDLDPRPFDLAVREAQIAVDDATLRFRDLMLGDSIGRRTSPDTTFRQIALTRSGLAASQVRLARARFERERASVVAPFGGVVDRVAVAVGERVTAGQELTTVVDVAHLRIEATVLEHDLPMIRAGGDAVISSAALPNRTLSGRIAAVLPRVDSAARAGRAYVRVDPDGALRPGMYADVRLEARRLRSRRLVPAKAVIERDGRPLVFVVKDGRAQWVYIVPGRSNGEETEVLPDSATGRLPIEPGDPVIVDGHLTLTHDAPVRVLAPREQPRERPRDRSRPPR